MTEAEWRDEEFSLFAVGTTLLRNRWRILRWVIAGGVVAALSVISRPTVYSASASFIPQGGQAGSSGLASLAGQFGVSLPAGNPSLSPDFYVELLKSPAVLTAIVRDSFTVQEKRGRRMAFLDLFEIPTGTAKFREEEGVRVLAGVVKASMSTTTGIVKVSVATPWPSVSVAVATAVVNAVDQFNQRSRKGQAAAESKFVEGRLVVASAELRAAEDRMQRFLATNREFGNSPELAFERERIQRDVTLRQQVYVSLMQSYEEVRMREVRDTPVITLFESPTLPTRPEARGRLKAVLLGFLLGGLIGVVLAFASQMMARSRLGGSEDADEFVGTLKDVKGEFLRPVRWVTGRKLR